MNNKFLEAYRGLENELRYENKSVLDYENKIKDSNTQEKLKLCRICRNYMAHQDTNFVSASKDMIAFIENLTKEIRLSGDIVKNHVKKAKTAYSTDSIKNIIPLCAKNKVPIVDKKSGQVLYIADADFIVKQLAKNNKKLDLPKKLPKYKYIDKEERIDKLSGLYIVTSDGTSTGKYIGILEV